MNEFAKKWATTLFSNKYPQTIGCLRNNFGYSVLGVACELYQIKYGDLVVAKHRFKDRGRFEEVWSYDRRFGGLPEKVVDWLGISTPDGSFFENIFVNKKRQKQEISLSLLNDFGFAFQDLSIIISNSPEGLFGERR